MATAQNRRRGNGGRRADRRASVASEQRLTIDQLAQTAGLTVRNVRNYQSRGLIPPPEVQGRVGYYGAEHLARLQLIREMQAQGFNLTAIAHLLEEARGSGEEVLGFTRSLMAPFETEAPEIVEHADLLERLGGDVDPEAHRQGREARPRDPDRRGLLRSSEPNPAGRRRATGRAGRPLGGRAAR